MPGALEDHEASQYIDHLIQHEKYKERISAVRGAGYPIQGSAQSVLSGGAHSVSQPSVEFTEH